MHYLQISGVIINVVFITCFAAYFMVKSFTVSNGLAGSGLYVASLILLLNSFILALFFFFAYKKDRVWAVWVISIYTILLTMFMVYFIYDPSELTSIRHFAWIVVLGSTLYFIGMIQGFLK